MAFRHRPFRLDTPMSQPATIPPFSRSWKDIRQGVSPRAMSKEGRRRMVFASVKFAALCVFLFGGIWAAVEVYQTWESDPARLKEPVKAVPLRQIVFATDGVLERAWLDQTLALPASTTGVPMTYMIDDRQYIVVATGARGTPAELLALALP